MAATFTVAILANAAVCGIFSYAHDRYGARIVWIAVLFVAVALAQRIPALRKRPARPAPAAAASERARPAPAFLYARRNPDGR
jgi:hypothetical protein